MTVGRARPPWVTATMPLLSELEPQWVCNAFLNVHGWSLCACAGAVQRGAGRDTALSSPPPLRSCRLRLVACLGGGPRPALLLHAALGCAPAASAQGVRHSAAHR